MDLWQELERLRRDLSYCIKELRKNGTALAEAERAYKARLRAECLALRDEGCPVTLMQLTVYGVDEVAELRYQRDVAKVVYEANKDAIYSIRLEIKVVQSQLAMEMGSPSVGLGDV